MKDLITILTLSIIVFIIAFSPNKIYSTVMAEEITYECIGQDSFLIQHIKYRNCKGTTLQQYSSVQIAASCGSSYINLNRDTMYDITPVCENHCNRCTSSCGAFPYGVQKHIYTGILDVSQFNCCDIKLYISSCCRYFFDDTYLQSNSHPIFTETFLNKCAAPCNNSVRFNPHNPVSYICKDQDFVLNPGITEIDGDSLRIMLTNPLVGYTLNNKTHLEFITGFSKKEPFPYLGKSISGPDVAFPFGFHFDTTSGIFMFRPVDSTGETLVSILVEEFRNDTLIGTVRRDHHLIVLDCQDNKPPVFKNQQAVNVCIGDSLIMHVNASDPDSTGSNPDSVFINWISGHENAEFVSNPGSVYAEAIIKWLPDSSDIGKHTFHLEAFDNGCPISARSSQIIEVNVHPPPEISYAFEKVCDKVMFSAVNHANQTTSFHWSGDAGLDTSKQEFEFFYPETGTYHFTLEAIVNHCDNISFKDSVVFSDAWMSIELDFEGTLYICADSIINISANAMNATIPLKYLWNNGDTTASVDYEVSDGDAFFTVEIWDSSGCYAASDTVFIKYIALPEPVNETYTLCHGEEVKINGIDPAFDHKWFDSDGLKIGDSNSLILSKAGWYIHQIEVETIDFCSVKDTFEVITLLPDTPYVEDITACRGENVSLIAESSVSKLHWYDAALGVLLSVDGRYDFNAVSSKDFKLHSFIDSNGVQCGLEQIVSLEVLESPIVDFTISSRCVGDSIQFINKTTYSEGIETLSHYWEFGFNEGTSEEIEPYYIYQNSGLYQVNLNVFAPNGCESYNSRMMEIFDLPYAGFSYDVDFAKVSFTPENENYISYHWDFGDGNSSTEVFPEHEYSEKGEYVVILKVEDVNGCISDDTMIVVISTVSSTELIENIKKLKLEIYPNPFTGETIIRYQLERKKDLKITLYNILGNETGILMEGRHDAGSHEYILDPVKSGLTPGIYMIQLQAGEDLVIERIVYIN